MLGYYIRVSEMENPNGTNCAVGIFLWNYFISKTLSLINLTTAGS